MFGLTMRKKRTSERFFPLNPGCFSAIDMLFQFLKFAKSLAMRFLLFLFLLPLSLFSQPKKPLPNVVIIYSDDLGYGDPGCYGATRLSTPHIDALAAQGLRFTNAHTTSATCTPSRYGLLTGQYPWRKQGTGVLPGDAALVINTQQATLASIFKKAGYATAVVGKWHLGLGNTLETGK